ncbi:hypothetical protein BW731_03540 [Vagococcus martis]|uniref:Uncharacterized protein n=1 Tax=Vagococcus martis TaxID=1768210 RepID=A0A1V4DFV8_9ENTE|nr:hypothetical protein [Vagococcus martis]OPF87343.1 hypothetical protein BW731_03540 [Vagococcus martis]
MFYILTVLSMLYGILMALATIKIMSFSEHPIIFIINLVGALCLILYVKDYRLLYVGVAILFIAALLNGMIVLNRLTPSHIVVRLIVSLVLIGANYLIHYSK